MEPMIVLRLPIASALLERLNNMNGLVSWQTEEAFLKGCIEMFPEFLTWRVESLRITTMLDRSQLLNELSPCQLPQLKILHLEHQRIESMEVVCRMEMPRLEYLRLSMLFLKKATTD